MRLTWLSNCPWTPYGYGVQTALFTTRFIKAGIDTAVISTFGHQGNAINWNGVTVFGNSFHPYGMDVMHAHSKTFKADALISMLDVQVMEPEQLIGTPWIAWTPVDHITLPPTIAEKLKYATAVLSMSKHGSAELLKYGINNEYIPCAFDPAVYKPGPMAAAREQMLFPADKFIVGMVAANKGTPSRKAFQANITAFAALQKKYGDCMLYLHTLDGIRGGWDAENLIGFCQSLGLKVGYHMARNNPPNPDVIFADQYGLALGYSPELMAQLYNAMDVFLLVSMGEGFGIPLIEAQACGTPVITGGWTSMPELCLSGWKLESTEAELLYTPMGSFQCLPHASAIAERLEMAYKMRGNQKYRQDAAKRARPFSADRITEKYWLPALEQINAQLGDKAKPSKVLESNLSMLRGSHG